MEDPAAPRRDADHVASHPAPKAGPDQVVYRRRQEDWLSDGAHAAGSLRGAARHAAIEVAKATLVARDSLTGDHSDDVGLLCSAIAGEFDLDDQAKANLMAAAQLHDIGKVGVPESILQKPGPLTDGEWDVIHEHTIVGEQILRSVPELREVADLVRHSHEHWDGSGYPDGLADEAIPLESRIILCADAFHAVRSPRPYRGGRTAAEAFDEIKAHSGQQFDPKVVDALGRTIERVRSRRRAHRPFFSSRAVLGNRRLAVLLLAMVVSGSAFAALNGRLGGEEEAEASRGPKPCVSCFGLPEPVFASPGGKPIGEAGHRAASSRRRAERAAPAGGAPRAGTTPRGERTPGSKAPRRQPERRAQSGAAAGGAPGSGTAVGGGVPRAPKVRKPRKVGPPPYGNAYGIPKRLQNPHPPKPPPGLIKPKHQR